MAEQPTDDDLTVADALARQLALLIRIIQRSSRYPGSVGMDRAAFQVLVHLAIGGPQRAGGVAEAVCSDPSTVSRRVAALVKDGLIERRADPDDGRASLLAVTEKGLAALEQSRRHRAEIIADALAAWPLDLRRDLVELLERFTVDFQRGDIHRGDIHRGDIHRGDFQHHDIPAATARRSGGGN